MTLAIGDALDCIWSVPRANRAGFLTSRLRGLLLLSAIGTINVVTTVAVGLVEAGGMGTAITKVLSLLGSAAVDLVPRFGATVLDSGPQNPVANSAVSLLLRGQTIRELYEVRLILEPAVAAKAATNRTDEDLLAIRGARTHFRAAYEMGVPVCEADIEFHQAIAEASRNAVLARILTPMSDLLGHARKATGAIPAAVEVALEQHDEIAAAIEARASA